MNQVSGAINCATELFALSRSRSARSRTASKATSAAGSRYKINLRNFIIFHKLLRHFAYNKSHE